MYLAMLFKEEPESEENLFSMFDFKSSLIGNPSKNRPLIKASSL